MVAGAAPSKATNWELTEIVINGAIGMKRTHLNIFVDVLAFAGFVVLTTTGVLMRYVLPPGSGHYSTIWNLDRHEWGGIHSWVSVTFFTLLAVHLVLHWRWIASVVTGRPREGSGFRAGLGLVGLTTVLALSIAPLTTPVDKDATGEGASFLSSHRYEDISIRGSMSLSDVEAATGVPAAYLIESLRLPSSVSTDERLGLLKRRYGFDINSVREAVKAYEKPGK
jgi:hypothetical protein